MRRYPHRCFYENFTLMLESCFCCLIFLLAACNCFFFKFDKYYLQHILRSISHFKSKQKSFYHHSILPSFYQKMLIWAKIETKFCIYAKLTGYRTSTSIFLKSKTKSRVFLNIVQLFTMKQLKTNK